MSQPQLSLLIVSFNTKQLLKEVLQNVQENSKGLEVEVIVIDNASKDGSADMVDKEFPHVVMIRSSENLGFARANNVAAKLAAGEFLVLLNSDAFLKENALAIALKKMEHYPKAGLGGGRLVGRDGVLQPSDRPFPSLCRQLRLLSGTESPLEDNRIDKQTDWVPGAFSIIRRSVFEQLHGFDENFFLYFEEVDLCKRIKKAGYEVWYWPEIKIVHYGGESSKTMDSMEIYSQGSQLALWEMRSGFLYWHKQHGPLGARMYYALNRTWQGLRKIKHGINPTYDLLEQAWKETQGGSYSPPRPW